MVIVVISVIMPVMVMLVAPYVVPFHPWSVIVWGTDLISMNITAAIDPCTGPRTAVDQNGMVSPAKSGSTPAPW